MTIRITRVERLLNLIAALLHARSPLPVQSVLDLVRGYDDPPAPGQSLERSRKARLRRFERDKATLRQLGVPIVHDETGYFIPRDRYGSAPVALADTARARLRALRRRLPAKGSFSRLLGSALSKVETAAAMGDEATPLEHEPTPLEVDDGWLRDPVVLERALDLAAAAVERRPVRFGYRAAHRSSPSEQAERTVEPHALGVAHGVFYLAGHCRLRGATRVFRLDRIATKVTVLKKEPCFDPPRDEIDLDRLIDRPPWDYDAEDALPVAMVVRVALPKGRAWHAALRDGGQVARAEPAERVAADEDVVVFRVRRPRPFLTYLLGHAPRVRVLSPPALASELADLGRRTARRHRDAVAAPTPTPPVARQACGAATTSVAPSPASAEERRRLPPDEAGADDLERLRRVLSVIPLIRARPGISVGDLARRLGADDEQVLKDLSAALLCGVPPYFPDDYVSVVIEGGGVHVGAADHFDRPPALTERESLALTIAVTALRVSPRATTPHRQTIVASIEKRRELILEYWSASSECLGIHHVRPLGLIERGGEHYLVAFESGRANPLTFRLDRIRRVEVLSGEPFLPLDPAHAAEALARVRDAPVAMHGFDLTVSLRGEAARWAPADGDVLARGEEEIVLRRRAGSLGWAAGWVLQQGDEATVLEPEAVRDEVVKRASQIAIEG